MPKLSDEKKNNLYDRANHFRRSNEYDKAMGIYEQILNEDTEDAESYWSLVLCTYGIEYVEDPATHRRVPTVNRAQVTSVFADENYKSALKYADAEQRSVYEAEAREIEQIQKGILAISSKEEPFDVFICYKESDANGRRTPDSVLANDLYHQLTQEGFKVFFARITLEDKLGSVYEPYIFAALQSSKVMVVLGTKPEYFNAVWVKNEWSRYLALIKNGANKILIPAYRDMDPYDLPEEMSHLQAQDMSKLGFMQDLIRGIKKIAGQDTNVTTNNFTQQNQGSASGNGAQALVDRAFLFLEDGDFTRADELCEQALNQDPKNAKAYVGKLMAEKKLRTQEALSEGTQELTGNNYFQKAIRFAEDSLKNELNRCNQMIMDRDTYEKAVASIPTSITGNGLLDDKLYWDIEHGLKNAVESLQRIPHWKDSVQKVEECSAWLEKLPNLKKQAVYERTTALITKDSLNIDVLDHDLYKQTIQKIEQAISAFNSIIDWEDSRQQAEQCEEQVKLLSEKRERSVIQKLGEAYEAAKQKKNPAKAIKVLEDTMNLCVLQENETEPINQYRKKVSELKELLQKKLKKKRRKRKWIILSLIALLAVLAAPFIKSGIEEAHKAKLYESALMYTNGDELNSAIAILEQLGDYRDSEELLEQYRIIPELKYEFIDIEVIDGDYVEVQGIEIQGFLERWSTYSIEEITIPESMYGYPVKYIGEGAFKDCDHLISVELPDSVIEIKNSAFYRCSRLESIKLSEGTTRIGDWAFSDCSLTSIEIPESVTQIGTGAFSHCWRLTDIEIPEGVTQIESETFRGCSNLTSIEIPKSVTLIGWWAFSDCDSLTRVEIPENVTLIGYEAFYNCFGLTDIEIKGMTQIGNGAFGSCDNLTSIVMSENVTQIGEQAFAYCRNLTSIEIPEGVTQIGNWAFAYCSCLTSIEIPKSVTQMGEHVVLECNNLEIVRVHPYSVAESWAKRNVSSEVIQYID